MHFRSCLRLAAMPLICLVAAPARAAGEDMQVWSYFVMQSDLSDTASASFELSPRLRAGGDQLLTRASVDFTVSPDIKLGGGTAWVEYSGGHEFRLHQQAQFAIGPVSLRSRAEERMFKGADRPQLRLRQRVQITLPATADIAFSGGVEYLYIARTQDSAAKPHTDSWRANAGISYRITPGLDASAAYLAIFSPKNGTPGKLSHVPQLRLVWHL